MVAESSSAPAGTAPPADRVPWARWELATLALFAWIAIEDQLRKWFQNPLPIYAAKDLLIAWTLFASARAATPGGQLFPRTLARLLAWGGIVYLLGSLNPRLPSLLVPVNGIHMTFFAMPLFVVGARFAGRPAHVPRLLWLMLGLGTLVAIVGMIQALVDPSFLNPAPEGALKGTQLRMARGDVQYVTGTFLSAGRYFCFLLNAAAVGISLFAWERASRRRAAAFAGTTACAAGLITGGARAALICVPLLILGSWVAALARPPREGGPEPDQTWARSTLVRQSSVLILLAAACFVVALGVSDRLAEIVGFYWENLFGDNAEGIRARAEVNLNLEADTWTWLIGNGTGIASLGLGYVLEDLGPGPEGGFSSVVWEMGVVGLAFYAALALWLSRHFLRPRTSILAEALAVGLGPLVLIELWLLNLLGPVLQQYTVSIPLWFLGGLLWGLSGVGARAQARS